MSGITREGRAALGDWVRRTRLSPEIKAAVGAWLAERDEYIGESATQAQFARWLTAKTGFRVSESAIGRLERSDKASAPPTEVLAALTNRGRILQLPSGPATLDDAIAVMCGELDPITGERKDARNGASNGKH